MSHRNTLALRLGGPIFEEFIDPDAWIAAHIKLGYNAAYCPVEADASDDVIKAYSLAAQKSDIIIAEVGAWSNPISPDEKIRKEAFEYCCKQLDLADRIGAKCCVNIAGSRTIENWAGPHPDNLSIETFDMIVKTTQEIIDLVKPVRTYFTLEPMPWIYPDSIETYVNLIDAINRKQFAVHFDPVNLINCPERYFTNSRLIREFFGKLGPYIKSCHAKDSKMSDRLTTHIDEVRPGLGKLDYRVFLKELAKYPDTPLMLEHLAQEEEYLKAASYIRSVAQDVGLSFGENKKS